MKTTRRLLAALATVLAAFTPSALALTVREGFEVGDFPNDAASAETYVLDLGGNDFIGVVFGVVENPPSNLDADFFKVTVLPGRMVTGIQRTGSAPNTLTTPLYAGTYTLAVTPQVLPNNQSPWSFTFTVAAAPDYEVTVGSGQMVLTDRSGFGDTLTVSEPFAGTIKFAAPGRTFSLNGAAFITGNSGSISHAGISSLTVNAGAGSDTIAFGAFGSPLPGLTINGGTGDDTVNFNGNLWIAVDQNLDVDLQNDDANPGVDSVNVAAGAQVLASGLSTMVVRCSQSVTLGAGSRLDNEDGDLEVAANQQTTPTAGNFIGVHVAGGSLGGSGSAENLTVAGRGGNAAGGGQIGVLVSGGGQIAGYFTSVNGTGGLGGGQVNRGVTVAGAGSLITGAGSTVVTGQGGGVAGSDFNIGVTVLSGGVIRSTLNGGGVHVTGTGGSGGFFNQGIEVAGAGSAITSPADVDITARAGTGTSVGLWVASSGALSTTGASRALNLDADRIALDATADLAASQTDSSIVITGTPLGTGVVLGGDDGEETLGLTDAELDRLNTSRLHIRSIGGGVLTIAGAVSPAFASELHLSSAVGTRATAPGTDVTLPAAGTLFLTNSIAFPITGTAPDTGYPQLKVAGQVSLSAASLNLTGTTFAGSVGDTFTLIDNDGADAIVGTFSGLPEGASLVWPGATPLNARISYLGGDGNDAVLTLFSPLTVTNNFNSVPGSLPHAVVYALQNPGADTIDFAPWLSGQTIVLAGLLVLDDADGVTIDATALPGGVTVSGNGASRVFVVNPGKTATLRGLTIIGGTVAGGDSGGAILSAGTLTLTRCTLFGNSAGYGGAIFNDGNLTLTQCTLAGNSATAAGTAIFTFGTATLTHCTVSGNSTASPGTAAIHTDDEEGFLTLNYSIVAGNTPNNLGGFPFGGANNLTGGDPLLAPLGDYSGPTMTMALKPGSPALNAATGSAVTADQRGVPIVGTPDIGAYEAGIPRNYAAWDYETLPATATLAQRAPGFDYDGDGRLNVLEYATFTDGAVAGGSTGTTLVRQPDGTEVRFTFTVNAFATDLLYELQRSLPGVGPWVTVGDVNLRTGLRHNYGVGVTNVPSLFSIEFRDPGIAGQGKAFYRLQVSVP
jgi:hypothetical protein